MKALLRRAELFEKTEQLEEALKDYQQALEIDPGMHCAREACMVGCTYWNIPRLKYLRIIAFAQ